MNWVYGFVFNASTLGIDGDESCKCFRNGDRWRGKGIKDRVI